MGASTLIPTASKRIRLKPHSPRARELAAVCATVALAVAGCSTEPKALGTHTAQMSINGQDAGSLKVDCEQVQWVWHIESLKDTRGFTAQVRTGDSVKPRAVQIHDLGGFTGSFWDLTVGKAEATVDNEPSLSEAPQRATTTQLRTSGPVRGSESRPTVNYVA